MDAEYLTARIIEEMKDFIQPLFAISGSLPKFLWQSSILHVARQVHEQENEKGARD